MSVIRATRRREAPLGSAPAGHHIAIAFKRNRGWRVEVRPPHVDAKHLDQWAAGQGEALAYANRLSRLRGWPIVEEDRR